MGSTFLLRPVLSILKRIIVVLTRLRGDHRRLRLGQDLGCSFCKVIYA